MAAMDLEDLEQIDEAGNGIVRLRLVQSGGSFPAIEPGRIHAYAFRSNHIQRKRIADKQHLMRGNSHGLRCLQEGLASWLTVANGLGDMDGTAVWPSTMRGKDFQPCL